MRRSFEVLLRIEGLDADGLRIIPAVVEECIAGDDDDDNGGMIA